jgi:hypothetical protein
MNRYEKIMAEMTVEKMAEMLTDEQDYTDFDGTHNAVYINDEGRFWDKADAIAAEIEYLKGADE